MSKKQGKKKTEPIRGIPWTDLDIGTEQILANLDKDTELGEIARIQFTALFDVSFVRLLQLMREQNGMAGEWVSRLLARAYVSLHKHHGKFRKESTAYRDTWEKLKRIRPDVLLPTSPVGQFLQEELRTAKRYWRKLQFLSELLKRQRRPWLVSVNREAFEERKRSELVWQLMNTGGWVYGTAERGRKSPPKIHIFSDDGIKAIEKAAREARPTFPYPDEIAEKHRSTWQDMARQWKIPKEYWALKNYSRPSEDAEKWWDFIYTGRLNAKQEKILPRLRESGKDRAEAKVGTLYLKHFYKQFRRHWSALITSGLADTL